MTQARSALRTSRRPYISLTLVASALLGLGLAGCTSTPQSLPSSSAVASSSSSSTSTSSTSASTTASASSSAAASASPSSTTTSTVGALVAGFPSKSLPILDGAQVKQSAYERGSDSAKASLVLTTSKSAKDAVDFYTKVFTSAGFKQLPGDAVGSLESRTFVRNEGAENANVSALTDSGTTTVTVAMTVAPGSLS